MSIVSTSTNDTLAGTGARKIQLDGLDDAHNVISEVITLNGTTPVATVKSYYRIIRLIVTQAGTTGTNAGEIKLQLAGVNFGNILPGFGSSLHATHTVRNGEQGFLHYVRATCNGGNPNTYVTFRVVFHKNNVFTTRSIFTLPSQGGYYHAIFDAPITVSEGMDIEIRAVGSGTSAVCTAHFGILLVPIV